MYDQWFVHDEKSETTLPSYVANAITVMMAFPKAAAKAKEAASETPTVFTELPATTEDVAVEDLEAAAKVEAASELPAATEDVASEELEAPPTEDARVVAEGAGAAAAGEVA